MGISVAQLFGAGAPAAPAPTPVQTAVQQNHQQQVQDTSATLQNAQVVQQANAPAKTTEQKSGLDEHIQLWETVKDEKGQEVTTSDNPFDVGIFQQIDPAKLNEQLSKRNFAGELNQEVVQKALSGDMAALSTLLNQASQNAAAQVLTVMPNMIEGGLKTYHERSSRAMPQQLKQMSVSQQLAGLNKNYQHPALRPFVESAAKQFLLKNPDATPAQIAESVNNYMSAAALAMGGKGAGGVGDPALQAGQGAQQDQDFSEFWGQ